MPPWAAFEWERTGWTLERIPTETPCSAAASAARCPARPAPITSTSCVGKARASLWEGVFRLPSGGSERAADLIRGHDSPQHTVAVHRHHRSELREALRLQERFERRLLVDLEGARVADHHLVGGVLVAKRLGHLIDLALREHAEHVSGLVDHREPRVAVAQEELLLGLVEL